MVVSHGRALCNVFYCALRNLEMEQDISIKFSAKLGNSSCETHEMSRTAQTFRWLYHLQERRDVAEDNPGRGQRKATYNPELLDSAQSIPKRRPMNALNDAK